jgi:2-alkenal reductase
MIVDVMPGSPADRAHLHRSARQVTIDGERARVGGDVIVAMNGLPVKSFDDVVAYLARNTSVGQALTLTVLRGGRNQQVTVTLAARPAQQ